MDIQLGEVILDNLLDQLLPNTHSYRDYEKRMEKFREVYGNVVTKTFLIPKNEEIYVETTDKGYKIYYYPKQYFDDCVTYVYIHEQEIIRYVIKLKDDNKYIQSTENFFISGLVVISTVYLVLLISYIKG